MWYDERARRWSTAGCSVANVTETAVVCECSHLTDFAVRFAALDQADVDLFASDAPLIDLRTIPFASPVVVTLGAFALAAALAAAIGARSDRAADARFARALAADSEIALAARVAEARGAPLPVDRGALRIRVGVAGGAKSAGDEEDEDGAREGSRSPTRGPGEPHSPHSPYSPRSPRSPRARRRVQPEGELD
jgi:hypothetical protein